MFCPNCGTQFAEGAFCPSCGTAVNQSTQPQATQPQATQPTYTPAPFDTQLPMKWYKFVIYFSLFASAVLNLISGISMLSGSQYGEAAAFVYSFFPSLKTLDIFGGIAVIGLAAFAIYTRMRLAKFCKNGPNMLLLTYALSVVVSVLYIILALSILPSDVGKEMDFTNLITQGVTSVIMIVLNKVYFDKRSHLFVN